MRGGRSGEAESTGDSVRSDQLNGSWARVIWGLLVVGNLTEENHMTRIMGLRRLCAWHAPSAVKW